MFKERKFELYLQTKKVTRFCYIMIFILFPMFFGKAQNSTENRQLLRKANQQLIIAPDKTEEITTYLLKDSSGKKLSKDIYNLKIKSLYYQGRYNEILDLVIHESEDNKTERIIVENIFRSLAVAEDSGRSKQSSGLEKLNHMITSATAQIQEGKFSSIPQNTGNIVKKINPENRFYLRENVLLLIEEMLIRMKNGSLTNGYENIRALCKLYAGDQMFELLYLDSLIYDHQMDQAENYWKSISEDKIINSSNLQLKFLYYQTLVNYYFGENNKEGYLEAKKEQDKLAVILSQKELKARSYYFFLKQNQRQNEINEVQNNGKLISGGIIALGMLLSALLLVRLFQLQSRKKEYESFLEKISLSVKKKTGLQVISEKTENDLLIKLESFENSDYYTNPTVSLQTLAKKLGTNTKYLSETINKHKEKNFNGYINELRIQYILKKLKDESVYRTYKIKYLAEESGFATHSQFTAVFKSVSGMSPANYIKLLNDQQ